MGLWGYRGGGLGPLPPGLPGPGWTGGGLSVYFIKVVQKSVASKNHIRSQALILNSYDLSCRGNTPTASGRWRASTST
jgi:hypothetical protein